LAGARVLDTAEIVVGDSGLDNDTFNVICRARLSSPGVDRKVTAAIARFGSPPRAFSWWSGPSDRPAGLRDLLVQAGLQHTESELMMSTDLEELEDRAAEGLVIRTAKRESDLTDFAGVIVDGAPEAGMVMDFYRSVARTLLAPDCPQRFYIGYRDGQPVATAELTLAASVGGIYGVVTREAWRRRGFGTAMMRHSMNEARAAGVTVGILQATAAGAGLYQRLGFEPYATVQEFKPPARRP